MKFYQENKINPLAGCLPLLVQMPIFFALFNVMRDPYKYIPDEFRPVRRVLHERRRPRRRRGERARSRRSRTTSSSSGWTSRSSATGVAGRVPRRAPLLHPRRPRDRHRVPPGPPEQAQRAEHELADGDDHARSCPIGFGLFSLQFPAGLVLYFFVSNLWRLGQQELIMRKITRPGPASRSRPPTRRATPST